ncbi:MAG: DUF3540 domain-containing protein [Desulfovibrionaceae bacterium]
MYKSGIVTPIGEARANRSEGAAALAPANGLESGRILDAGAEDFEVLADSGRYLRAKRAAACLLAPEAGDVALFYEGPRGAFILSVLEKAGEASTLSFSGDVRLVSGGKAAISGREVDVSGVSGTVRFVDLSVASKGLKLSLDKAVCLARTVESTLGNVVQRMKYCFRQVSEVETLKAGSVRQFIADRFYQRSRNTAILADERVKVDGDKIELG